MALIWVPPAKVCNVTAAALVWFLTVSTSPAAALIVFSLGGDWAGQQQLYSQAGCPGTCVGAFLPNNV